MPAIIALLPQIIAGLSTAISAAPNVINIVNAYKTFISELFTGKVITKEQQDDLHTAIDGLAAMMRLGIVPPAWQVMPDPGAPQASNVGSGS